jgi:hypothetical protein
MVDVDLHVTEPSKFECFYAANRSPMGAQLSRDFTQGTVFSLHPLPAFVLVFCVNVLTVHLSLL